MAMEAGIHPIFVDCPNLSHWEMRPYVQLAERLGYVATIVDPSEINESCEDLNFLVTANDTAARRVAGKAVNRGTLRPMIELFESFPADKDPLDVIRGSRRAAGHDRLVE